MELAHDVSVLFRPCPREQLRLEPVQLWQVSVPRWSLHYEAHRSLAYSVPPKRSRQPRVLPHLEQKELEVQMGHFLEEPRQEPKLETLVQELTFKTVIVTKAINQSTQTAFTGADARRALTRGDGQLGAKAPIATPPSPDPS